jgi:membrane-bound metal-dependent hydrolase YbcI (DUF457 family)
VLPAAHLGIGQLLASPWSRRLPLRLLLLGTLLPDLLDKPIYYSLLWTTGRHGAALGLFSGSRCFGHSLLFFFLLGIPALAFRNRGLGALALGVATHLLLDNLFEPFQPLTIYSSRIALFFPLYYGRFPVAMHHSLLEHMQVHWNLFDLAAEIVGLLLLWRLYRQRAGHTKAALVVPGENRPS